MDCAKFSEPGCCSRHVGLKEEEDGEKYISI